jgi:hypothetical protein
MITDTLGLSASGTDTSCAAVNAAGAAGRL